MAKWIVTALIDELPQSQIVRNCDSFMAAGLASFYRNEDIISVTMLDGEDEVDD